MTEQGLEKRSHYLATGALYILGAFPGAVFLLRGEFLGSVNPYLLLPLVGVLPGLLLVAAGLGRLPVGSRSGIGLRVAYIGISFTVFMMLSLAGVAAGVEPLGTSVVFCATAASYLALVSLVFLVLGVRQNRSEQ